MDENQMYCKLNFLSYNEFDKKQNIFLDDIANDKEISRYINNIVNDVIRAKQLAYIVEDFAIDEYVGVCVIKPSFYDLSAAPLEYAVHYKYRNSLKKYGRSILLNLCDKLFINDLYSKMVLEINEHNIASIKAAIRAGFKIDYNLVETFYHEGYAYIPYTKDNPNYLKNNGISKKLN